MKGGAIHMRDLKSLPMFDLHPNHAFHRHYAFTNKSWIDYEWIQKQMDYIQQLSDRQKHIAYSYTNYGDELMNNFLRGSLTQHTMESILHRAKNGGENPLLFQHQDKTGKTEMDTEYFQNSLEYVSQFIDEFKEIIKKSPKLTRPIKVFRGLSNGQFIVDGIKRNNNNKEYFINREFISSSIFLPSASQFIHPTIDCCLLEMTIDASVNCLFTAFLSRRRGEFEITIEPDTCMNILYCRYKLLLDQFEHYDDIQCFTSPENYDIKRKIRMCSVLIVKK